MEIVFLLVIFICQGSCVYLRVQEIQKNIRLSDIKKGWEVISLKPLSYLQDELEPRKRADYSIENEGQCVNNCKLVVDSEGRIVINALPKANTSLNAVASVSYQGLSSTTTIKLRILDNSTSPLQCPPPSEESCFSSNYTFRVAAQELEMNPKEILLGHLGSNSDCYKTQYFLNITRQRYLMKNFRLNGDALYFLGGLQSDQRTQQIKLRIRCLVFPADSSKDNSTRRDPVKYEKIFPINVIALPPLPYPTNGQTKVILLPNNTFQQGNSLLLSWYWIYEDWIVQNKRANDLPVNTELWIESVSSNTFNLRSNLLLIYLNWTNEGVIHSNKTFTIALTIKNKHQVQSPFHEAKVNQQIKLTVVLRVDTTMEGVNYTTSTVPASEIASPFSRLVEPQNVRTLHNKPVLFRSGMAPFVQSPYTVTEEGGIVYLKDWGPQGFPCQGNCPKVFIIEWTKSGNDYERRIVLGSKVFRVVEELKTGGSTTSRCKEQGMSEMSWDLCSKYDDSKSCNRSCGLGAFNGMQSLCSWREAKMTTGSTISPNEVVPSASPLTLQFATCRADPTNCPDRWCDPLEKLNSLICPQDCSNHVTGGMINHNTSVGIYSSSPHSVCTCTHALMCHCGPPVPNGKIPIRDRDDIEAEEIVTTSTPPSSKPHQYQSLNNDAAYCDMTCKTAVGVSSTVLFLLIAGLVFIRKRRCLGLSKTKGNGTEEGTLSIDPLVPLQTMSTSPTTATDSTMEHNCDIDVKWELPRSRIEILETLGEGEFGKVLKARAKDLPSKQGVSFVAVKTLKENAGTLELNDLLSEYQLLKEINHPNVIKLLGACTSPDGPIYVIIEYCSLGSLRNYLRKNRNAKAHECLEAGSIEVTPKDILSFSWQISKGMSYLAEMKMVHRDLATRNILLAENKKCKISDFGMTRDVYVDDTYLKVSRSRVPVKWMALESLREHVYTSKSDVWSMGIVLWELVTLGSSPYPGIPAEKLYGLLTSGYRMPRPSNCSNRLYEVMRECWAKEPYRRPTFQQLVNKFESMLGEEIEYLNCNINAFSNPAYFNGKPNTALNNLDIRFSMSLDDLKSFNAGFNLYENELNGCPSNFNYDVPRPQNIYVQSKRIKDKIIDEKVDNR